MSLPTGLVAKLKVVSPVCVFFVVIVILLYVVYLECFSIKVNIASMKL